MVDGDTVEVDFRGRTLTVRLIGIDTPESVAPGEPVQCFAIEASSYTTERLEGERVRLQFDVERIDPYGRTLAYVWLGDELFNETLVREGYAFVTTYPPNVRYVDRFRAAQREARSAGRGVWGRCVHEGACDPAYPDAMHPATTAGPGLLEHRRAQVRGPAARSAQLRRRPQRHRVRGALTRSLVGRGGGGRAISLTQAFPGSPISSQCDRGNQTRIRPPVRVITSRAESQWVHRSTMPGACTYACSAPTDSTLPHPLHAIRADVISSTNTSPSVPAIALPSSLSSSPSTYPPVGPNRSVFTLVAGYPRSTSAAATDSTNEVGPHTNVIGMLEAAHATSASIASSTRRA